MKHFYNHDALSWDKLAFILGFRNGCKSEEDHAWQAFGRWSSTFSRWKFERGRARWRMIVVLERGWANLRGDMTATVMSTRGSNRRGLTGRGWETRTRYSAMLTWRKQSSATRLQGSAYFHRNFNPATLQMRLLEREPNTFSLSSPRTG